MRKLVKTGAGCRSGFCLREKSYLTRMAFFVDIFVGLCYTCE